MGVPADQGINVIKDLGEGLVLRQATPADSERLADFNGRIHNENDAQDHDERINQWTNDLTSGAHLTTSVSDFTIVEDMQSKQIVSTMVLISQTWSYAGIPFKVGRPELVGTDPQYRERGLVRAQFETIHGWSAARGELVQGITGIPYYYRQFGYEMGMELGGGRAGFIQQVPKLEGEEPFSLRIAAEADIPLLIDIYERGYQRYLVSCVRDELAWRYELSGRSPLNVNKSVVKIIESPAGDRVGFITHPPFRWGGMMAATSYEIKPGVSWVSTTPTILRYLKSMGEEYSAENGKQKELETFGLWLGSSHPVYDVIPDKLLKTRDPYAWFLRVPDIAKFLLHISPQLEKRLAGSSLTGHSGEIKITFYGTGLRMVFKGGRLALVEDWIPEPDRNSGDAGFPGLTFLQMVFGFRNLSELKYAFADCWTKGEQIPVLLDILFPKMASSVWPIS